jgi:hypothetical protein
MLTSVPPYMYFVLLGLVLPHGSRFTCDTYISMPLEIRNYLKITYFFLKKQREKIKEKIIGGGSATPIWPTSEFVNLRLISLGVTRGSTLNFFF